jgi:hypothetical protein
MQATTDHLTPEAAQMLLMTLPEQIRLGLLAYAAEIEQPVEVVIEMAIAGFLDEDALSFSNCRPLTGMKFIKQPEQSVN